MPYYRVGNGCVWDVAVALIVGFAIWRASHRSSTRRMGVSILGNQC